MARPSLARALAGATLVHDTATLGQAIGRVAAGLDARLDGREAVFLPLLHGALVFAGQLATAVSAPLVFDYVHATRYRGALQGGELHWLHRPATPLAGKAVVLVDDILDEGHTLAAVRAWCLAEGAAEVLTAVLCTKRHDRCLPGFRADFSGLDVPDAYVFGYGMDFHGQGRNLPAIYALAD